jgi:hypothetical protein
MRILTNQEWSSGNTNNDGGIRYSVVMVLVVLVSIAVDLLSTNNS